MEASWADSVTAIATLLTVFVTLMVGVAAFSAAKQSANVAAASIVPWLYVSENILADELGYSIVNAGLGPAIITGVEVQYPEKPHILRTAASTDDDLPEPVWDVFEQQLQRKNMLSMEFKDCYGKTIVFHKAAEGGCPITTGSAGTSVLPSKHWRTMLPWARRTSIVTVAGNVPMKQGKPQYIHVVPSLSPKIWKEYKVDYRQAHLLTWVGSAVGTHNVKEGDFRVAYAKKGTCSDEEWQVFVTTLLGHIAGITLIIHYTDAMHKEAEPLRHTFGRKYYDSEADWLRQTLNTGAQPSEAAQGSSSDSSTSPQGSSQVSVVIGNT